VSAFDPILYQKRISSEKFPSLKLRSSIGFRGVVTNAGVDGVLVNSAGLEAKMVND